MDILYSLDKGFCKQLIVSVYSVIKNTKKSLRIFIVSDGLPMKYKKVLKKISSDKRINIIYLDAPIVPAKLIPDRGGISQYYRMFIGEIFNDINIKRVIYLDADTLIVNDKIELLEDIDLKGKILGGCLDPWGRLYRKPLGLRKGAKIFNSGVLVIDVLKWKLNHIDCYISQDIEKHKKFRQGDQGILNRVFENNFFVLQPNFNSIDIYFSMSYEELLLYRKPISFYKEKEVEKARRNPVIVHFTSSYIQNRPWVKGSKNPFSKQWISCYDSVMGEKIVLSPPKKVFLTMINDFLPPKISRKILSFLQSVVRPIIWRHNTK